MRSRLKNLYFCTLSQLIYVFVQIKTNFSCFDIFWNISNSLIISTLYNSYIHLTYFSNRNILYISHVLGSFFKNRINPPVRCDVNNFSHRAVKFFLSQMLHLKRVRCYSQQINSTKSKIVNPSHRVPTKPGKFKILKTLFLVGTQRHFNVHTKSSQRYGRCIDVETTLCLQGWASFTHWLFSTKSTTLKLLVLS